MQKIWSFLEGKKTFIAAAGLFLTALASFIGGDITTMQFLQEFCVTLGMVGIRLGVGSVPPVISDSEKISE